MRQRVSAYGWVHRLVSALTMWGVGRGNLGALIWLGILWLLLSPPVAVQAQDSNPLHGDPEAIAKGAGLYTRFCPYCHGTGGRGGSKGPNLTDERWIWGGADSDLFATIIAGRQGTGMGAFGARIAAPEVWSIIAYLRSEFKGSLAKAREKGVLTVCVAPEHLPASAKNPQPAGFDLEIASEVARRLELQPEYFWVDMRKGVRRALSISLTQKRCDLFMGVPVEEELFDRLRLTKPYFSTGYTLIRSEQGPEVTSLANLAGKTTAVAVKSEADAYLAEQGYERRQFGTSQEALEAVQRGDVELALLPALDVSWWLSKNADSTIKPIEGYVSEPNLRWNVAIAVRAADFDLQATLDSILETLTQEKHVPNLMAQYGVPFSPPIE